MAAPSLRTVQKKTAASPFTCDPVVQVYITRVSISFKLKTDKVLRMHLYVLRTITFLSFAILIFNVSVFDSE